MSKFLVTITGRWDKSEWDKGGEEFRVRFSERGAYEDVGGLQQQHPHVWQVVSSEHEADTATAAVQAALAAFETDATGAGMTMAEAFRAEVEPLPIGRTTAKRTYSRPSS